MIRRNISIALMISFLFLLCGCNSSKKAKDTVFVGQNELWYSSEVRDFDCELIGSVDKTLPIYVDSNIVFYNNTYDNDFNELSNLLCVRNDTTSIECIDYSNSFDESSKVELCSCFKNEDDYYLVLSVVNENKPISYIGKVDFDSLSIVDIEPIEFNDVRSDFIRISKVIARQNKLYIGFIYLNDVFYNCGFKLIDLTDNSTSEIIVDEEIINWTLDDNDTITYLAYSNSKSKDKKINEYKLDNDGVSTIVELPEDLVDKISRGLVSDEGYVCSINDNLSVSIIDLLTLEETLTFSYNNCDANIYELSNSILMYADYDCLVFLKEEKYEDSSSYSSIIRLDRSATNPNVGKEIVFVAPFLSLSQREARALQLFNERNADYICYVTMDYSMINFNEILKENSIVEVDNYYERELLIVDILEQAILAGIGPDILLGFGQYASLNNTNLLFDLDDYIDSRDGLNRDEYFNNLFCSFEQDDDLFQIPLSSCVVGIYTLKDYVAPDTIGFTYETYQNLITEKYGGFDPLETYYGQSGAFRILLKSNYSYFYENPYQIDLENEAFKEMAEYSSTLCEYYTGSYYTYDIDIAFLSDFYNETYYMILGDEFGLYGLPSSEERGTIAEIYTSAAIPVCSDVPKQSWNFIKLCLSEEVQLSGEGNPINKNAFINKANSILIDVNEHIEEDYGISNYYDQEIIDTYVEYLSSANKGAQIDSVTMVIMNEELAPYFSGNKSLEEVIPIIESRVNNMLAERKP